MPPRAWRRRLHLCTSLMTGYGIEGDNRIFSSEVCVDGAMSLVASRGQQLPGIPSPAGREEVGQVSSLLLTVALRRGAMQIFREAPESA